MIRGLLAKIIEYSLLAPDQDPLFEQEVVAYLALTALKSLNVPDEMARSAVTISYEAEQEAKRLMYNIPKAPEEKDTAEELKLLRAFHQRTLKALVDDHDAGREAQSSTRYVRLDAKDTERLINV